MLNIKITEINSIRESDSLGIDQSTVFLISEDGNDNNPTQIGEYAGEYNPDHTADITDVMDYLKNEMEIPLTEEDYIICVNNGPMLESILIEKGYTVEYHFENDYDDMYGEDYSD